MRSRGGFTLIEMMVVILLLGVAFTYALVNLDSLTPRTRLDKGARDVGDTLTRLREMAVFSGRVHFLEYDLDGERFRIYRPATTAETSEGASEYIETDWFVLPDGVRLEDIQLDIRSRTKDGQMTVEFTPTGEVTGHLVHLTSAEILDKERGSMTVALNPITGLVSYSPGDKDYGLARDEYEFR